MDRLEKNRKIRKGWDVAFKKYADADADELLIPDYFINETTYIINNKNKHSIQQLKEGDVIAMTYQEFINISK